MRRGGKGRGEEFDRFVGVGEGERDRVPDPIMVGREGDDGLVNPRRIRFPLGRPSEDCSFTAPLTWPCRLGYCGRDLFVKSLKPPAECTTLRAPGELCIMFLAELIRLPVLRRRVIYISG